MLYNQFTLDPAHTNSTDNGALRHLQKQARLETILSHQLTKASRETKSSKALGLDKIAPIMLDPLGATATTTYLTDLLSLSMNTLVIPNGWKAHCIILNPAKSNLARCSLQLLSF